MMKISEFVELVQTNSKKRTGAVLADFKFRKIVDEFSEANVTVLDCANYFQNNLLLTDDQLISMIRSMVNDKAVLILNIEMFIAPRLKDGFLEQFIRKMAAEEPRHALILLFYSNLIFRKFKQLYHRNPSTLGNILDLSKEDSPDAQ